MTDDERKAEQEHRPTCQWFALCPNEAVMRKPNPLFPEGVWCCQRCSDRADRMS